MGFGSGVKYHYYHTNDNGEIYIDEDNARLLKCHYGKKIPGRYNYRAGEFLLHLVEEELRNAE